MLLKSVYQDAEKNRMWDEPDDGESPAPTEGQQNDYIGAILYDTAGLRRAAGLWQGSKSDDYEWQRRGIKAVEQFLLDEEEWSLAQKLQVVAIKLASGTAHIDPETPKTGPGAPSPERKSKRETDFEQLEATLEWGSDLVEAFKEAKQSNQLTK